jgi:hypothetical protein
MTTLQQVAVTALLVSASSRMATIQGGYGHNSFVRETLVDELAARAKADPIAYRTLPLAAI